MSTSASPSTTKDSDSIEAAIGSVKQKRSAERQLTKDDDPDDDGEDIEGAGDLTTPFPKANEQVLKSRRILRARRPVSNSLSTSDGTTTTETTNTATSSLTSNPFASTTLLVEPQSVQLPAPGTDTSTKTPAEPKVSGTSEPEQEQSKLPALTNEEQIKDKVENVEVTRSAPETSSSGATGAKATATYPSSTSTATTPGPFKVFGSFAGFGGGFTNSGFGTAAPSINTTVQDSATTDSTSTGFAFASTSNSTFGTASSSNTSATAGSIFGSVSSNSFSFGFANQTNGEAQTVSPKVTLPESVELTTGEEEELNLHDCRCKTFKWVPAVETEESTPAETKTTLSVKPSKDFQIKVTDAGKDDVAPNDTNCQQASENNTGDEKQQQELTGKESPNFRWQELGVGPMKLLQDNSDPPKYRLVQRRESSPNGPATKVLLNLPLYKESKVSLKAGQENYLSFITIGHDGCNETYLWKFKEVSQAQIFARFLEGILPHARSCFVG